MEQGSLFFVGWRFGGQGIGNHPAKESILDLLTEAPWWISLVFAGAAFLVLRYILPSLYGENLAAKALARTGPVIAPWLSVFVLIPAPISVYNSWRKRKLLDSQKNLDSIRSVSWKELEQLVGEAYRCQGYTVRENAGAGPDGGIDVVLSKKGKTFLVQCKQWRSWKIGVKVVREMHGLMPLKKSCGGIITTEGRILPDKLKCKRLLSSKVGGNAHEANNR